MKGEKKVKDFFH